MKSDKEMYEQYPYHFRLGIRYTLTGNTIETGYLVENLECMESMEEKNVNDAKGSKDVKKELADMPFLIGGHPGFNCPMFPGENYSDYFLEFEQEETCTVPTPITETGLIDAGHRTAFLKAQKKLPLDHDLFAADAVILDEIQSRTVSLKSWNHHRSVTLDFPYLILWSTANKGSFIALEPWMGLSTCSDESDVFEEKRNVQLSVYRLSPIGDAIGDIFVYYLNECIKFYYKPIVFL